MFKNSVLKMHYIFSFSLLKKKSKKKNNSAEMQRNMLTKNTNTSQFIL